MFLRHRRTLFLMKVTFTIGATAHVLCDETATPPVYGVLEQWPTEAILQVEPLYLQQYQFVAARGNAVDTFVFVANGSYDTLPDATAAIIAAKLLAGQSGTLAWKYGTSTVNSGSQAAVLGRVEPVPVASVPGVLNGLQAILRYTFRFTALS